MTNAVKHFKWKERGPRRIHDKPTWTEQVACRPWLEAELALVQPRALVLLGATAAQTLLGRDFRVTRSRGEPLESDLAELVLATIHPSAVLRADDQEAAFAGLVDDLRAVGASCREPDPRWLLGLELRPLAKRRLLPAGLPAREWLAYYATRFDTVEVNATFYRLPRSRPSRVGRANARRGSCSRSRRAATSRTSSG